MSKGPVGLSNNHKDLRKGRIAAIGIDGYYTFYGEILSNRKGVLQILNDDGEIQTLQVNDFCTFWTDHFDNDEIRSFKWHWDRYECNANW